MQIVYLIDFETIRIQHKQFCIREMAISTINPNEIIFHKHYKPCKKLYELPKSYRNAYLYCKYYVHGLDYYPETSAAPCTEALEDIVNVIPDKNAYVGYKGGCGERRVLNLLGYDNIINIEDYGCPKFNNLTDTYDVSLEPCSEHRFTKKVHCPKDELKMFGLWLKDFYSV